MEFSHDESAESLEFVKHQSVETKTMKILRRAIEEPKGQNKVGPPGTMNGLPRQAVLDLGRVQRQGELHLTGVLRGDIQHDPLSKKVLVVCFVVLFVVCFVCCGFGAFLSKKQEAKQAKQGSKKAKQAKQGGRRKTEGETKNNQVHATRIWAPERILKV